MSAPAQEKRNALTRAVYYLRAKARCKTHVLSCFLDAEPSALVPRPERFGATAPVDDGPLVVNPGLRYAPDGALPADLHGQPPPLDGLLRGHPIAWVEDPGTGVWAPFWARGEWTGALASLRPGRAAPVALSPAVRRTLALAGILLPPGHAEDRRAQWLAACRAARAQLQAAGYVILRELIPPLLLAAMRRYYRGLVGDGRLPVGDAQVAQRYRLHSEPVASFLHPQLTGLVGRIAGEPVKPSYVYFASYPAGSELPRHQDREQCEFSISLLVDYVPEPDGPCGWPLFLEDPERPQHRIAADLGLGDALVYRGRRLVHYRERLTDGHSSTSIFFHWVREDFAGDLF